MKLLLKLLGVSDYIEELKGTIKLQDKQIKDLTIEANSFSEMYSSAYQTNTDLTNELNKLRQQITNQDKLKDTLTAIEQSLLNYKNTNIQLKDELSKQNTALVALEQALYDKDTKLDNLKCFVLDKINQLAKDLHNYD